MSDIDDKRDYDIEATFIQSGHGQVTTGVMRYAHKRIEELEAENAKLKLDIKELRETLDDEGVEL